MKTIMSVQCQNSIPHHVEEKNNHNIEVSKKSINLILIEIVIFICAITCQISEKIGLTIERYDLQLRGINLG